MKKFVVIATRAHPKTFRAAGLAVIDEFTIRAHSEGGVKGKAIASGLCLRSDTLQIREARRNANGDYIE